MAERRDLPLFAWGAARHAARRRRRRRARQAAALGLGCACLAATIVAPPQPRLLWNASASAPVGLWRVTPVGRSRAATWWWQTSRRPSRARRATALYSRKRAAGEARHRARRRPRLRHRATAHDQRAPRGGAPRGRHEGPPAALVVGVSHARRGLVAATDGGVTGFVRRPLFRAILRGRRDRQGEPAVGRLKVIGIAAMLGFASPAATATVADWRPFVAEASLRFGLPAHGSSA
jgi:hypothetical protein